MISNVNSSAIVTSSICEPLAIVTSRWSIILTLYLWTLSSSQWRCQPGRFSMAAHRHDRRGIYRCALLRFHGRIEIDHSYGLRCRGLCCHSWHSRGWVGLWGFLWWAPSAKRKDHHGVSSGWSSVWHRSNTGLSSTQYEQIPIILGVWPFWLTPFFFRSITFWRAYG